MNEAELMKSLPSHPNIVQFVAFFEDSKYYYIVMELATQDLNDFIKQ